ncbi:MAG: hypothetical protein EOO26_09365 [Comamonadaceae bacterium]|nr:MAG: hypothetical protein EOO26_09365 [Comamonadaceae bacterium]
MRCTAALLLALFAALCGGPGPAHAQAPVTDPYGNYRGVWRGDFLFTPGEAVNQPPAAARTHEGSFEIAADGAVRGVLGVSGCTLAGTSSTFVSAANATLDVGLTGCRDARFNGRYAGRLINNPSLRYASLRLARLTGATTEGGAQVSAIVRR